ncbi:MAG: hypothetical protein E7047_04690 [Lentisphaerae bacterium]|nr:hypothetical protein [Lentisphaerota bacterium]
MLNKNSGRAIMGSWHFVGICGIGMSALAQFAAALGIKVSGSDRALENPENEALKTMLQAQGIQLFAQDGSRFASGSCPVDALVYSTAIEEGNPEFAAAGSVRRIHRAAALKMLIQERCVSGKPSIAVAGSCGKTSTTALIAEALCNMQIQSECVNGGMIHAFAQGVYPGNYHPGSDALIFEADESDKSLLEFHPDYALVLNIGTDHYPKAELVEMFAQFVNQAQKGAILLDEVYELLKDKINPALPVITFGSSSAAGIKVNAYHCGNGKSFAAFNDQVLPLPAPGWHTALNVAAAAAVMMQMQIPFDRALEAALRTRGVARRFDFKGRTAAGAAVYDDYAHNPEKVANILKTAQDLAGADGRVLAFFQPHGYGPFGFMAGELGRNLQKLLRKQDVFYLAEPYYAGGTSSFSPHAADVLQQWHALAPDLPVYLAPDRAALKQLLLSQAGKKDLILIMGARDNTLAIFAADLAGC